ncbi:hypothetical protein QOZ80_8AG0630420 [Eleusine coracana subsp. coracana]|nr:hypothetical protein QOZ80_8AG0630420 [Eleusine coracana subsp. coracana]
MSIFKSLACRNLIRRSSLPSPQPSRWLSIRKALLSRATAAADSITAALTSLSSKRRNQYAPAASYARHARIRWLTSAEEERTRPPDHPHTVRVRRIAAKLIPEACEDRNYGRLRLLPERIIRRPFDDIDWNVGVLHKDCMDAYSNYKGMIRISTGLLEYLRNDAQVATVLGHEVGHVIARHIEKSCRNWLQVRFLVHFLGELLHVDPGPSDKVMRNEWGFLFMRPCYFRHEFEADRIGLLLIAAAGNDPRWNTSISPKEVEKGQGRATCAPPPPL